MARSEITVLIIILFLAFILRLWGIGFGLPHLYHFDEPTYVSAALNLGAGIIGRQPAPTGFSNILFGEYAGYFVLGRLTGLFTSVADFERTYRLDPSVFVLLARLTSALLGVLNVVVLYWLGRELRGQWTGALAALFLALSFLHVRDSHYGVPDVSATFFVTLTILFCLLAIRRSGRLYYSAAAIVGGFAVATKWSVWQIVIPLALTALYIWFRSSDAKRIFLAEILSGFALFGGGFLIGGFQILLKPRVFLDYALNEWRAGELGGFNIWQIDTVSGWLFYLKTLNYGLGSVMLLLAIMFFFGYVISAVRTRDLLNILVLSFPATYYLFMGSTPHYFARYALPLVPFATLFAAAAITAAVGWIGFNRPLWKQGLMATLALAAIAQPLAYSIQHNVLLTREDTRTIAKRWIEDNIPVGAKIAVDWPVHGPPLSTPEKRVPSSKRIYNVIVIGGTGLVGLPERSIQWYREQEFDYLIASSFIYNIPSVYESRNIERQIFYDQLAREFELVKEFRPYSGDREPPFIFDEIYGPMISVWERDRPGPTLKIYRVIP